MLNIATMIRTQGIQVEDRKRKKHKTQLNKTQVIAKTKDFLVDLFYSKRIKKVVKQILYPLKGRKEIIRPNRSFSRPKTSSRRRSKIINFKGI